MIKNLKHLLHDGQKNAKNGTDNIVSDSDFKQCEGAEAREVEIIEVDDFQN